MNMESERMISILEEFASASLELNKLTVSLQSRIRDIITLLKTEGLEDETMDEGHIIISNELSAALITAGYHSLADIQTAISTGEFGQGDGLSINEMEAIKKILSEYSGMKPGPEPAGKSNKGGL